MKRELDKPDGESDISQLIGSIIVEKIDINEKTIDETESTILHLIVKKGGVANLLFLEKLLKLHEISKDTPLINFSIQDKDGNTPLHILATKV